MPRRRDKLQDARSAQIARDRAARRRSRKERRRALESVDLSVPRRKSRLETFKAQCSFRDWDHPERSTSQLDQLLETLGRRAPKLLIDQYRQPIWRLARTEWIRPLEEWKPKGKSRSSIFRSLVRHLVELYPTPQFLLSLFHDLFNARGPTEALYVHLAQGGSLKKALATNLLRTSMTKRMCHDFLQSPANMGVIEAVRRAQVRSFGGTRRIADAIVGLRMGENLTADESFWLSVVQWTCNQPMLDPNEVGPIFDWVGSRLCEDPDRYIRPPGSGRVARRAGQGRQDQGPWKVPAERLLQRGVGDQASRTGRDLVLRGDPGHGQAPRGGSGDAPLRLLVLSKHR